MERTVIYELESMYRDSFRVTGFRFGSGEKTMCVVGSMRGNEVQQLYCCSQLVDRLKMLEANVIQVGSKGSNSGCRLP